MTGFSPLPPLSPDNQNVLKTLPFKEVADQKADTLRGAGYAALAPAAQGEPPRGAPVPLKEVGLGALTPAGPGQCLEQISSWRKSSNALGRKLIAAKNNRI